LRGPVFVKRLESVRERVPGPRRPRSDAAWKAAPLTGGGVLTCRDVTLHLPLPRRSKIEKPFNFKPSRSPSMKCGSASASPGYPATTVRTDRGLR